MQPGQRLLQRLDAIGASVSDSGDALALLGLGSVGAETERLDAYSDLDFFVIVKPGCKPGYLSNLDWLARVHPLAYSFQNTVDGYKALFADGIFCEFAVFEPQQLASIPFTSGRLIWKDDAFDETLCVPRPGQQSAHTDDWLLGESLTNLYIGLGRVQRGEMLSGTRFIQSYAVDHVLELAASLETAQGSTEDPFARERRYERRYPQAAQYLPAFIQGYNKNAESALAILLFLEQHFEVNPAMSAAIREVCTQVMKKAESGS
jgi:lincosamide nucleotidyltransferase